MNLILLFSHKLTKKQITDAKKSLKIENFIYLPQNLKSIWSQVPNSLNNLDKYLEQIKLFLKMNSLKNDYVLIQGDFGATYEMVNYTKELNLNAIYSTNKRDSKEKIENNKVIKTSSFEHYKYRKY